VSTHRATISLPPVSAVSRPDAVSLLSWYLLALMAIPSALVVAAFGAAGRPATLLGAALLGWYLLSRAHPDFQLDQGRQPVRAAAIGLTCSVLFAYISANRSAMSVTEVNAANRGLILLAGWLGVMLLAADGIADSGRLEVLLSRIVLGATAMAVLGVAEFATGTDLTNYVTVPGLTVHQQLTDLMVRDGLVRVNSTAAQPLEFSAVLTMSLPLAIHQARHALRRRRLRRWLQVAIIAGTIPMAVSRSAMLALAIIAVILIPTWPASQRRRAYLVLTASAAGLWMIVPGVLRNFATIFGQLGSDTSTTSRADALAMAMPLIAAHPWFGLGFATFSPQTYLFVDDQFLTSLIETGVVGLLALLAVFAAGWHVTRRLRRTAIDRPTRDLAWCLTASLAVALISFGSFDVLSFSIAAGLFFLIAGCAGAAWRLAGARQAADWPGRSAGGGDTPRR
jgi:O-antigen ligase